MSQTSILVVDNFYPDPWKVRDEALRAQYVKALGFPYPGRISATPASDAVETGSKIYYMLTGRSPSALPTRGGFGHFRTMHGDDMPRELIHAHEARWTGLIYLSHPKDCDGGIVFFRHKEWGSSPKTSESHLINEKERIFNATQFPPTSDCREGDPWIATNRIEMAFNRLVAFNSYFFHSFTPGFGDSLETCRITQNFDFIGLD